MLDKRCKKINDLKKENIDLKEQIKDLRKQNVQLFIKNLKEAIKDKKEKEYNYFISFIYEDKYSIGYGNATTKRKSRIMTYEDIKEIEKKLLRSNDCWKGVVIQSFNLI